MIQRLIPGAAALVLLAQPVPAPAGPAIAGSVSEELSEVERDARGRAEILFARGRLAWADADAEAALTLFEQAASTWPQDATYIFFAARADERLGRLASARDRFARALPPARSRVPEWRVRFEVGRGQYLSGEAAAAETQLRRALDLEPDDAGTRLYLGLTLLDLVRPDEAIPLFEEAGRRARELSADAHYYTGVAALRCGDSARARDEFEQVVRAATRLVRHSIPEILADTREYLKILEPVSASPPDRSAAEAERGPGEARP